MCSGVWPGVCLAVRITRPEVDLVAVLELLVREAVLRPALDRSGRPSPSRCGRPVPGMPDTKSAWMCVSRTWVIVSLCLRASSTYTSTSRRGSMTAALPVALSPIRYDSWATPSVNTVSKTMLVGGLVCGLSSSAFEVRGGEEQATGRTRRKRRCRRRPQ